MTNFSIVNFFVSGEKNRAANEYLTLSRFDRADFEKDAWVDGHLTAEDLTELRSLSRQMKNI